MSFSALVEGGRTNKEGEGVRKKVNVLYLLV
jgi:hypothetical protein